MSGFLNLTAFMIDHSFIDSIGMFGRGGFDVTDFDVTVPQALPAEARLEPYRAAMGLPPRDGSSNRRRGSMRITPSFSAFSASK